jgi:hypothetical protein
MDASKAKKEASAEKQDRGMNEVIGHHRRLTVPFELGVIYTPGFVQVNSRMP